MKPTNVRTRKRTIVLSWNASSLRAALSRSDRGVCTRPGAQDDKGEEGSCRAALDHDLPTPPEGAKSTEEPNRQRALDGGPVATDTGSRRHVELPQRGDHMMPPWRGRDK